MASEFRFELELTKDGHAEIVSKFAMATAKRQAKHSSLGDISASPEVRHPLKNKAMARPLPHFFVAHDFRLRRGEKEVYVPGGREEFAIPIGTCLPRSEQAFFSLKAFCSHQDYFVLIGTYHLINIGFFDA